MSRGSGTCCQQADVDEGFHIWLSTDSERAQRWRLSLASLLFFTILLSDHLWFCTEAKLARTPPDRSPPHSTDIFVGNSSSSRMGVESCPQQDSLSSRDLQDLCRRPANMSRFFLSFCNSYSLLDLFHGSTSPDNLNCSLAVLEEEQVEGGEEASRCTACLQAYLRYDQHAQEKYEDFQLLSEKYEAGAYSVRTCMEQCKTAYKPWLCAQYFPTTQRSCQKTIPCHQYCLEVQQSCPFILPDNDDLIHGGSPSFICTGLLVDHQSDDEAECCDVRWDSRVDGPTSGTLQRTATSCQPEGASVTSAATTRLCSGRLKICLLALVLLHTVIIISASHNSTLVGMATIFSPEEGASNEE